VVLSIFFAFILVVSVVPAALPVQSQGIADEIIADLDRQIYPGQSPQTQQQQLSSTTGQSQFQSSQMQQQQPSPGQTPLRSPQMQQQQPTSSPTSQQICITNIINVVRGLVSGYVGDPDAGKYFDAGILQPGQSTCDREGWFANIGYPAHDPLHPADIKVLDHFDITITPYSGPSNEPPCEAYAPAQLPSSVKISKVPLEPGNGGISIGVPSLQAGDIIVSTTSELPSAIIRYGTSSPVSHSMLYIGDGLVIEAVGNSDGGVRLVPIETALADSPFAVAFRYPGLTQDQVLRIRDYAANEVQAGKQFNYYGIFSQALYQLDKKYVLPIIEKMLVAQGYCQDDVQKALTRIDKFLADINLGGGGLSNNWFCSELVLAAFAEGGVRLTNTPVHYTAPGDIPILQSNGILEYVGHLKSNHPDP